MDNQNDGWGSSLILILGMALCCGGPLLVIGLAAVGPSLLAAMGLPALVVLATAAVAGVGAIVALRRRAVACPDCELPTATTKAVDSPSSEVQHRSNAAVKEIR